MPSMMDAWFRESEMMASSGPNRDSNTPPLASKQLENRMVSSVPRNSETRASSSRCRSWVPQMKRPAGMPKARWSMEALGAVMLGGLAELAGGDVAGLRRINVAFGLEESCGADLFQFALQLVFDA